MENYNLRLKKFEELVEESYENLVQEQLNHPSMSDKVLGGTLLYGLILSHGRNMKEASLGNISDQSNLKLSDLEDVVDKVEMKMLKKYFDNFKSEKPTVLDPLLEDYDEEPIVERKLTKNKKKSNFFLYVIILILLLALGYYFYSDVILQNLKWDKSPETPELTTETTPIINDTDSTIATSQDGEWLLNNVRISEFRNGEKILEVSSKVEWEKACADKVPAYCHVNYDSSNDEEYGLLYNWYALTDERNICPNGYRLPKKADFEILISDSIEKNWVLNLKKNLPGYRDSDGYFKALDELLVIWSSEERFNNCIEALVITKNNIKMECYSPSQAYSIRFIQSDK
jgi:hypothetical protein